MPRTAPSMSASWFRARSRRPTPVGRLRCLTTKGVPSPVPSVASASTTRMSATTSSACRPSSRARPRVAVEVPEARAKARKGRGSHKDEAKARVKHRAKLEDTEAPPGRIRTRTRTRTRTGPGETPTLRQGEPILSSLVGSKTRGLRRVPRRKLNKNKGLSLLTKMGTSLTPPNILASCGRRKNCARRVLT